jgi:hypothetical protein
LKSFSSYLQIFACILLNCDILLDQKVPEGKEPHVMWEEYSEKHQTRMNSDITSRVLPTADEEHQKMWHRILGLCEKRGFVRHEPTWAWYSNRCKSNKRTREEGEAKKKKGISLKYIRAILIPEVSGVEAVNEEEQPENNNATSLDHLEEDVAVNAAMSDRARGNDIAFTSNDTESDIPMDQDHISSFRDHPSRMATSLGTPASDESPIGSPRISVSAMEIEEIVASNDVGEYNTTPVPEESDRQAGRLGSTHESLFSASSSEVPLSIPTLSNSSSAFSSQQAMLELVNRMQGYAEASAEAWRRVDEMCDEYLRSN